MVNFQLLLIDGLVLSVIVGTIVVTSFIKRP